MECTVHEVVHLAQFFQISEGRNALMIVYRVTLNEPSAPLQLAEDEVSEVRFVSEADMDNLTFFPEYEVTLRRYFANLAR